MADQNIGTITLEEVNLSASKDLGEYKGEEVQVSNGRYGPHRHMELLLFLCQRRKPFRRDFEKSPGIN
jgi:DNA topoisomerase-1